VNICKRIINNFKEKIRLYWNDDNEKFIECDYLVERQNIYLRVDKNSKERLKEIESYKKKRGLLREKDWKYLVCL
jgi:hypothetical protein